MGTGDHHAAEARRARQGLAFTGVHHGHRCLVTETLPDTEHASEVAALALAQSPGARRALVIGPGSLALCVRLAAVERERRHAAYDEVEKLRRGLPAAPTTIKEKETQSLLQPGMG